MLDRIKVLYITQILNIQVQTQEPEEKPNKPTQRNVGNKMLTPFD